VGVLWWSSYDLPLQVWGGGRGGLITVRCRALEICLLARGGKLGLGKIKYNDVFFKFQKYFCNFSDFTIILLEA
jgi:hypothetical protein